MKLPPDGAVLVQALERATQKLVELDPAEFASAEQILAERGLAVQQLVRWLGIHPQPDPELSLRLQKIFEAGASAALRLAVIRQDTVCELMHLNSEWALLQALSSSKHAPSSTLDCKG